MEVENRLYAVVGMKQSGLAAVELLLARGARVRAVEQAPTAELKARLDDLGVPLVPQTGAAFEGANVIVISPGVPAGLDLLDAARRSGIPVIGEVELAAYFLEGPVIGITGSNGKTTTTALTGHILREAGVDSQVGGNIGFAPTAMVASSKPGRWNVLELSSFQLETIREFRAHIALALNVTDNHLDRHRTFENYAAAKRRLFETQRAGDRAVLNADNAVCVSYAAATRADVYWFSARRAVEPGAWLDGETIRLDGAPLLAASTIPLRGRHNIENVMAAAIAARLAGAPRERIAAAVASFRGVEHRLEFVAAIDGVDYFNDSKATSVDAALKALDAFAGGLWVILGGHDKGSDYAPLREPLHAKARMALLIGEAAPVLEASLAGSVPLRRCGTLDAAVAEARREARRGDTVLLAPACSSYDQFHDFEERGRLFKRLVAEAKQQEAAWPSA